ncbi:Phosphoribosylanthranilate isomerase [Labilithrix luteola]|uniref:N-(5'-phosphoribosyl)anthranilate isomerase n=1 Tax=Labilithrix luteola TaxID=1391654 RepID=A0A0K1Q7I3_9BACT|nr:phosphoribosylanthranilate isomerase [Labilithrix luteola]AKV01627.1 Phosphoribosylanthranilate isomerase [Labilithrix luteola]
MPGVHVKICGLRTATEAAACAELGASAIGLNFVPGSVRRIAPDLAREIARAVRATGARTEIVGVVADLSLAEMRALMTEAELDCLQLHGAEPPSLLEPLLPRAYKAVRIGSEDDVALARSYPGAHLLVDAKVDGMLGGSGVAFDWDLVRDLANERKLTLAGGLRPDNVAAAVAALQPFCVDVASGVESEPGVKDLAAVRAFIDAARS